MDDLDTQYEILELIRLHLDEAHERVKDAVASRDFTDARESNLLCAVMNALDDASAGLELLEGRVNINSKVEA